MQEKPEKEYFRMLCIFRCSSLRELTLYPIGEDTFYNPDIISRDKAYLMRIGLNNLGMHHKQETR